MRRYLFAFLAGLGLVLGAGVFNGAAIAGCYQETPPGGPQPAVCPGVDSYVDTNGFAQSVSAAHPLPTSTTITPSGTQDVNVKQINGTTVSAGTGAQGAGAQRVTVATDSATVAGSASLPAGSNVIGHVIADTGSTTAVTGNVTAVQPTGTNLHAVLDTTSTTAVTQATGTNLHAVIDSGSTTAATQATGTNLHTVTDSTSVSQAIPGTSGGLTIGTVTAANSTNATNLKASAGQLYHITGYNNSATLAWVSFYNTAGTPSCGASIIYQMMIPANSTSGGGAVDDIPEGLAFSTGIGYCITTGIAGTGSVAASAYVVNFGYK